MGLQNIYQAADAAIRQSHGAVDDSALHTALRLQMLIQLTERNAFVLKMNGTFGRLDVLSDKQN